MEEGGTLTHEEIWDDSALIDSWNEALEEYKYYHSLHARGEKVEDVLRRAEAGEEEYQEGDEGQVDETMEENPNGTNVKSQGGYEQAAISRNSLTQQNGKSAVPNRTSATNGAAHTGSAPPSLQGAAAMPQTLLASGQDEALKNLMMSWYYAGYYTGLYEGEQKARQELQMQVGTHQKE